MSVGHCRGYHERWFYNHPNWRCEPFGFSGCGGNANNFRDLTMCMRNCINRDFPTTPTTLEPVINETATTKKWKPIPSHQDNEVLVNDAPMYEEDVDCQTGPWLGWSDCYGDCEYAVKLNYRMVVRPESGLGKPCQRLMKLRPCNPTYCRHIVHASATTTPSPDELFYTDSWLIDG